MGSSPPTRLTYSNYSLRGADEASFRDPNIWKTVLERSSPEVGAGPEDRAGDAGRRFLFDPCWALSRSSSGWA